MILKLKIVSRELKLQQNANAGIYLFSAFLRPWIFLPYNEQKTDPGVFCFIINGRQIELSLQSLEA